ncbi:aminoglycoside 6'-N-acetyltransferase [Devosia albogilva]|uniref:Aminoglycoside N(6')-acetyltransferase type 1 n=1 Tax=Devosia albogilva TaxID=429726 RepID=A0ABW5QLQ9_9HYPH
MKIVPLTEANAAEWLELRLALWPDTSRQEHEAEITQILAALGDTFSILAQDREGAALGFVEASLRRDYVNGTDTSPVAFLEGIYVVPQARGRGVARALVAATETWAREQGCIEFASDALLDNVDSHAMHRALGFEETERVVFFRKVLK